MKSGGPLKRYTELKPGKPLVRTAPFKSGGNKLEATAALKSSRPKSVPKAVKELLKKRSAGVCEVGLVCGGRSEGVDPAHREGKKAGGTSKEWSNLASNLLWACRDDHDFIDQRQPKAAEKLGLKIREGVARPWEIPVLHKRFGWVLLDHDGGHRPAPADSHPDGKRLLPVVACSSWDLMVQGGAFIEAMERYKHLQCAGWSAPREGLFTCGCGTDVFVLDVVA